MNVELRRLARADFEVLGTWLAEPLVARWWCHDHSAAGVERDFGPAVDGEDPTEMFIATFDERPFGLIQRHVVAGSPEFERELRALWPVPDRALSIDYLIGEPELRGRGLGVAMISAFVARTERDLPGARDIVVPVPQGNRASWRALARAGFVHVATGPLTPDNPADPPEHVVFHRALGGT